MPDDDPQPLEELIEQHEEGAEEGGGDERPRRRLPLRPIGIFGGIAVAAVAAAWLTAGALCAPAAPPADDEKIRPDDLPADPEPVQEAPDEKLMFSIDSIIVNLYQTEARRYLKATMAFAVKDKDVLELMGAKKLILTDRLIGLLSSKTINDIDGYEKKQELKREIRDEVNTMLGIKDAVTQVFFAELIIQ